MDTSSLIDLRSPSNKTDIPHKINSPLIPMPNFEQNTIFVPRFSDVENTPFDKVLRSITNKDDPFEHAFENAHVTNKLRTDISTIKEEKENVANLISPFKTPAKSRKSNKIATGPLYINESFPEKSPFKDCDVSKIALSKSIVDLQNTNQELNITDSSLQCLSESLLNKFDTDFGVALNIPLPDSPEDIKESEDISVSKDSMSTIIHAYLNQTSLVPSLLVSNGNNHFDSQSYSGISAFNNAFVDNTDNDMNRTTILSTKSSISSKNRYSFHSDSLGNVDISNIYPSVSSTKEISSQCTLDKAFFKNSIDLSENNSDIQLNYQRKCMSARKSTKYEVSLKHLASVSDAPKTQNLNNSFAGFNFNNRAQDNDRKQCAGYADDSVFLEATNLAHAFSRLANGSDDNLEDDNLYVLSPPWLQENINFCDIDNEDTKCNKESPVKEVTIEPTDEIVIDSNSATEEQENDKLSVSMCSEDNANDTNNMINAKSLLHNLTEILKCDGNVVDQRKLGENLLNSLALALNLEKPNLSVLNHVKHEPEETELEISSAENFEQSEKSPKQCGENSSVVPKIKTQSMRVSLAPTRFEKTLKVKTEKENVSSKGPLKAIIPVNNMAKNKRSIAPKVVTGSTTPPKSLQIPSAFQVKKTSTPYELKLKAPIAQSTPDSQKPDKVESDKRTPVSKRQFKYSLSPLSRPMSMGDISYSEMNTMKPLSPKDSSGSVPTLHKKLSPRDSNNCSVSYLSKPGSPRDFLGAASHMNKSISSIGKLANSTLKGAIPMNRRKSASDIKPVSNLLNKSYEANKKPARPTLLKRSSSFQSKVSTTAVAPAATCKKVENNNTYKKFGAPGSRLKSLCLLKKKSAE